jgi:putative metalloprotease
MEYLLGKRIIMLNKLSLVLITTLLFFTSCGSMGMPGGRGIYVGRAIGAAKDLHKAATISDEEIRDRADKAVAHFDSTAGLADENSEYSKRLARLTSDLKEVDGHKLDFKVVMIDELNACAFPNGSIRFFSGMMDKLNDDEILAVIGHEIGHVVHKHRKEKFRLALLASAARKGVASAGGTVAGEIAASQLGGIAEALVNAQFSQSEESEADDYGLKFLHENDLETHGILTVMDKFAELGNNDSMLSSHPSPLKRKAIIAEKINSGEFKTLAKKNKVKSVSVARNDSPQAKPKIEPKIATRNEINKKRYASNTSNNVALSKNVSVNDSSLSSNIKTVKFNNSNRNRQPLYNQKINRGWYIQVSSDHNYENAIARFSQFSRAGFNVYLQNAFVDRGNYYRLLVGPYMRKKRSKT